MGTIKRRGARLLAGLAGAAALGLATTPAWADLQPTAAPTWGANDTVFAVLPVSGETIIGGNFTAVTDTNGISHPAAHLAVIDNATGAVDLSWLGSADGDVYALAVSGNTLYVGGKFNNVDGHSDRKVGALDLTTGAVLTSFSASPAGKVLALAATPTSVFIGGDFTSVKHGTTVVPDKYLAKLDGVTGAVDTGWIATPSDVVRSLVTTSDNSTLYAGGDFTTIGSGSAAYSDAVTTADPATLLTAYHPHVTGPILGAALDSGNVYLAVGGWNGACASVNGSTGAQNWYRLTDGNANGITVVGGVAYCGGHFAEMSGLTRHHVAGVSTTYPYAVTDFAPNLNTALGVAAMGTDGTNLFAGGYFTKVVGKNHAHYAEFTPIP